MPVPSVLALSGAPTTLLVVVADVLLILVAARYAGRLAARLGQPPVIGEILAGIALGPSLLGLLGADLPGTLFPDDAREWLRHIGELGLVLFLFGVGRESDPRLLRRARGRIGALSAGSILVPAAVGALVALPLWADHATVGGEAVPRAAFAAFIAVALSVTAFPVLARILGDAGLLRSEIGRTAMAVAAVTDLVAWSALAVVVGAYGTGGRPLPELLLLVAAYALALRYVLRPAVVALLRAAAPSRTAAPGSDVDQTARDDGGRRAGADGPSGADAYMALTARRAAAAVLLAGLLLSALATDRIGLHAAIGAFAFGVLCPRDGVAGRAAEAGAGMLARAGLLLVPVFFLSTGLTVDLASLSLDGMSELLVLLVAATLAKFGGVAVAARLSGDGARPAAALGVLLNARGLTELVILEVGRSAGILDDRIFAALVAVALLTTVATGPLFRRLHDAPGGGPSGPGAARRGAHPGAAPSPAAPATDVAAPAPPVRAGAVP
ncbi:MAG: hypothetical protein F2817_20585, partial [Actinobacteria bacterium]|nr:hypothetical protein [Actinomycetota bacterium]